MKRAKLFAAWSMALAVSVFTPLAYAATDPSLPGIPTMGSPNFLNDTTLKVSRISDLPEGNLNIPGFDTNGFKFTARSIDGGAFKFNIGSEAFDITDGRYNLNAYFNANGELDTIRSNVSITGQFGRDALESLSGTLYQHELFGGTLFSARLDDFNFSFDPNSGTPSFGFETTDFGGWARQFGITESVFLFNFDPPPTNFFAFILGLTDGTVKSTAVTTVPLPGAAWLVLSSLLAFVVLGPRGGSSQKTA